MGRVDRLFIGSIIEGEERLEGRRMREEGRRPRLIELLLGGPLPGLDPEAQETTKGKEKSLEEEVRELRARVEALEATIEELRLKLEEVERIANSALGAAMLW